MLFENNLKKSIFIIALSIAVLAFLLLSVFFIAKINLRASKEEQLSKQAKYFAAEVDNFIQVGQIFLDGFAKNNLFQLSGDALYLQLKNFLSPFPYFSQLSVYDVTGNLITGYPQNKLLQLNLTGKDSLENQFNPNNQILVITNLYPNNPSLIAMVTPLRDSSGGIKGYLMGETDLRANPLNSGLIALSHQLTQENVEIYFFDKSSIEILSLTKSGQSLDKKETEYIAELEKTSLVVTQYLATNEWNISLLYPESQITTDTLHTTFPLFIFVFFFYLMNLSVLLWNRKQLPEIQTKKAKNKLPEFEELNNRLQDFREALLQQNKIKDIANLILNYSEMNGVSSVRLIISEYPFSDKIDRLISFGNGTKAEQYSYFDRQILDQIRQNRFVSVPDIRRIHQIRLSPDKEYPLALYAFPIRDNNVAYGALWLGYEKAYQITKEESTYIQSLIDVCKKSLTLIIDREIYKNICRNQNALLQVLKSPVLLLDLENTILYANRAMEKLIEKIESFIGENVAGLDIDAGLKSLLLKESLQKECEFEATDGNTYLVQQSRIPLEGRQLLKIIVFIDVSEEKINKANLSEYIALLSHELRSPITIMKGYASLLPIMGKLNEQQREYIEKILTSVEDMTRLIKDLLNLERLEMGMTPMVEDVDLVKLLDKVTDTLQPLAVQKRIELKRAYHGSEYEFIKADSTLIEQAIYNLVDNAIRFTPIQGSVTIEMESSGDKIEIMIKDTGIGLAAVDIPHIFEKFYRVKISPMYNQSGSGIGLALVKSIAERHNGEVGAISNLGKGTTFYFRLPRK